MTSQRIWWHFQHSETKKPLCKGSLLVAKLIFHCHHPLQALLARIPFTPGDSGIIAAINASLIHAILSKSQKLLFHFVLEREKVIISFSHFLLEYSHNYLLKIICVSFLLPQNAQTSSDTAIIPQQCYPDKQHLGEKHTTTQTLPKFHGLKQEVQGGEGKEHALK